MSSNLPSFDGMMDLYSALPEEARSEIGKNVFNQTQHLKFIPSPGPQTEAVASDADILLYGGEAGGGKSCLLAGLSITQHENALLMRRQYTQLSSLIDETLKLYGTRKGFNGSSPPSLRTDDKRFIQFGAADKLGDEQNWKGRPRDLLGIDEVVDFEEQQVRYLMGWVRSARDHQRCRVIFATNPPVDGRGAWVVRMFAPWLDPNHSKPAKPGELRWFVVDGDKDVEVDGKDFAYFDSTGKKLRPQSRTFIRARLKDNPYLNDGTYEATLDALPEPYRSAYRDGNFFIQTKDKIRQLIPSDWVRQAQARWTPHRPGGVHMSAMAVDISQGGSAETIMSCRYGGWFDKLVSVPGKDLTDGSVIAGMIMAKRADGAKIILDMGGGYGGETFRILKDNGIDTVGYKGNRGSHRRTPDNQLKFYNKRSESYWLFRCALDPNQPGGSHIMLPPDPMLFEDLTMPTFEINTRGIQMEEKNKVIEKLGRSTDRGDAVIMAWSEGVQTIFSAMHGIGDFNPRTGQKFPKVILGHENQRQRRK